MTPTDERLHEASDPATPGERLREMFRDSLRHRSAYAGVDESNDPVVKRIVRNAAFPAVMLREQLLKYPGAFYSVDCWYNPAVALLLLSEPSPEYQSAAFQTLRALEKEDVQRLPNRPRGLARTVATWALTSPSTPRAVTARDLARHLAGLFSLPWPEEAT